MVLRSSAWRRPYAASRTFKISRRRATTSVRVSVVVVVVAAAVVGGEDGTGGREAAGWLSPRVAKTAAIAATSRAAVMAAAQVVRWLGRSWWCMVSLLVRAGW
jgi:hypothetical protein